MPGSPDAAFLARNLGIDIIATPINNGTTGATVKRILRTTTSSLDAAYIASTGKIDSITSADIVTVASFQSAKRLLKAKVRKGLGMEFLVSPVRTQSADGIAKWLSDLKDAYRFCRSTNCQFILSSGAEVPGEMISGRCIDELLEEIDIDPKTYWRNLENWLGRVASGKVTIA
ncbi:MAG TPA: hypothetical protein VJL54_05470 [Nitrososphaera sp.]|nr:hypothetical protein [Nitrososphaera sp.]